MGKFVYHSCKLVIFVVGLAVVVGLSSIWGNEVVQFKKLKEVGVNRAKVAQQKFDKLFKEQPELKQYICRPSTRGLLSGLKESKGIDTIHILGIRIEFQPDTDTVTTGCGLMDLDHNEFPYDSLGYPTVGYRPVNVDSTTWDTPFDSIVDNHGYHSFWYDPPHTKRYFEHLLEFLHNYWWDVSENKIWIRYKVVPEPESSSYQLPYKLTYYGDPDNWVRGILTLIRDAITFCDQQSPEIDFSKYAGTSGGIIIFHAGASFQADRFGDSPYDIPDCFVSGIDGYFGTPVWVDNGTVPIVDAILYSETAFQDATPGYLQGGLCHEMGHLLGLPDLYDTQIRTIGIGGWELMATGNWNLNGLLPPSISAWSSEKLGFIEPVELTKDTTGISIYMRCGRDTSGGVPKIYKLPINTKEYFLIEERFVLVSQDTTVYIPPQDSIWHIDSTGVRTWKDGVLTSFMGYYDWGLPPDSMMGGLAIWHVDNEKIARDAAKNKINVGSPKGVDMEEADGIQDFEIPWWMASNFDALVYGTPWDVFYKGNADEFSTYTSPNTRDNLNSITNVSVYNIGSADTLMNFAVRFGMQYANFPVKCCSAGFFDVNSAKVAKVNNDWVIFSTVMDTSNIVVGRSTSFVGGIVLAVDVEGNILWVDTTLADPSAMNPYGTNLFSSVGIGDINGDDILDIVAVPFVVWGVPYKSLKVLESKSLKVESDTFSKIEGNLCAWNVYGGPLFTKYHVTDGAVFGAPLIADINKDGRAEILFGSYDGKLRVFNGNGDTLWTKDLHERILATPVWDSSSNILYAVALDGKLWALSPEGNTLWTAIEPSLGLTTSSPVVGDINRDGNFEIVIIQSGKDVFCVSDSGKIIWSRSIEDTTFYSSPALAFIDEDSLLDIIIAAGSKLYVLNSNGANVAGFPINTGASNRIQSSPVIGDINNDGMNEIIIGSPDGKLLAYNKGKMVTGFPLSVGGAVYSTPLIVDLNQDTRVEIFVGSNDGKLYGWSVGGYGDLPWPSIHRFACNNGIYEKLPTLSPSSIDAFMTTNFYIYPNPITHKGWVRYFSGDASSVNIKIINLAGEVVEEFDGKIGKTNYQNVLIPTLPSGVYLCRVEVKSPNKSLVRFKKFGVVK